MPENSLAEGQTPCERQSKPAPAIPRLRICSLQLVFFYFFIFFSTSGETNNICEQELSPVCRPVCVCFVYIYMYALCVSCYTKSERNAKSKQKTNLNFEDSDLIIISPIFSQFTRMAICRQHAPARVVQRRADCAGHRVCVRVRASEQLSMQVGTIVCV